VHVLSSSEGAFDATRPASCILSRHYGRTQAQALPSPKGVYVSMRAGVRWSHAGVSRRALLAALKGKWPSPIQRTVELPRLARPKECFAAHDGGSIDELSGHTTGRLGYIRPTTAHAIGGTAELALRYSIISAFSARPLDGMGTLPHLLGQQDRLLDYWPAGAVDTPPSRLRRRTFQGLRV